MLPVNLPREPSTAWKSRRTCHRTTLTWMPSWTTAGMGTWAVSTPGKVTWSGSTVILSYPSSDAVDSCIRLLCLHSTLRWQILHTLLTAPWSSHCPVTPARHCTWKTPSQTSRWSCQNSSCHMALTTESPWPASLILTHGTMCTTWQIPHYLNGHGSARQTAFQFSYHATRNHLMVTFRPSLKTCIGQLMMTRALPASGLARSGDVAAGPGKHTPHGSIPIKAGSGRELLCALQPSRQWSRDRQGQELPIAHCAC